MKKNGIFIVGTIALLLLIAGCAQEQAKVSPKSAMPAVGSDKAVPEMMDEGEPEAPPAPPLEKMMTEEKKPSASGAMEGKPASKTVAVSIKGFAFSPKEITVNAGDTIKWTNEDSAPHTVRITGIPESDELSKGDFWEHTFAEAGSFSYICGLHPSMKGTITVS